MFEKDTIVSIKSSANYILRNLRPYAKVGGSSMWVYLDKGTLVTVTEHQPGAPRAYVKYKTWELDIPVGSLEEVFKI